VKNEPAFAGTSAFNMKEAKPVALAEIGARPTVNRSGVFSRVEKFAG